MNYTASTAYPSKYTASTAYPSSSVYSMPARYYSLPTQQYGLYNLPTHHHSLPTQYYSLPAQQHSMPNEQYSHGLASSVEVAMPGQCLRGSAQPPIPRAAFAASIDNVARAPTTLSPPPSTVPTLVPVDSAKESNAANLAAFQSGELKHEPPTFEFFDCAGAESLPVTIKEIKLPHAIQTHEVCYEPLTKCVFVSQMSSSVLVRIPVDADGYLHDDHDAWRIGEKHEVTGDGISGLHNISLSPANPGCLWLSLEYSNELMLVDVRHGRTMRVRQLIEVPTHYVDPDTGAVVKVGGPHCVREDPVTGDIWTCLKGALKDSYCNRSGRKAQSSCCNPEDLEANMTLLAKLGRNTPIPTGWAIWRLTPSQYDPTAADGAKGGQLFPCLKSPPMLDFDERGNVYIPQDGATTVMYIEQATGVCQQLAVPFPSGEPPRGGSVPRITGPAIASAPDGSVWISLLGSYNALVRIDPEEGNRRVLYNFGGPPWASKLRLIHLTFSSAARDGHHNCIYAISTDLLDDEAINCLVILEMTDDWRTCTRRRLIPLPTQDCACHRIALVDAGIGDRPDASHSVVISELASAKVLQVKTFNLLNSEKVTETVSTDSDGFEVRTYNAVDDEAGKAC